MEWLENSFFKPKVFRLLFDLQKQYRL